MGWLYLLAFLGLAVGLVLLLARFGWPKADRDTVHRFDHAKRNGIGRP